jgi:hypothetical protein
MYGVEETIKGLPPDHRRRARQQQSKSIAEALAAWAEQTVHQLSRKSELAAAFRKGFCQANVDSVGNISENPNTADGSEWRAGKWVQGHW